MEKIEAFVFDMDGILLDTETICEKTWIKAFKTKKPWNCLKNVSEQTKPTHSIF